MSKCVKDENNNGTNNVIVIIVCISRFTGFRVKVELGLSVTCLHVWDNHTVYPLISGDLLPFNLITYQSFFNSKLVWIAIGMS